MYKNPTKLWGREGAALPQLSGKGHKGGLGASASIKLRTAVGDAGV